AAMANLDILERENLLGESKRLEASLHTHLQPLAEHPRVAEVRSGLGAVAAVQLADPAEALLFVKTLREHGISGRAAGQGAMQISPTFVMTDDQVAEMAAGILAALG
ncbi:aminotransferase class III-fold pyridoxal phosphate-dependent enzyme, partial [Rhodococcus erythropolis]